MARPSATAALLLLVFSLIAVGHCRPVDPLSATDADESANAAVIAAAGADENGPPNPTFLPGEAADQVILPAEGFLRLPSHRLLHRHRPCHHHGLFRRHHLWSARHHGAFGDEPRAVAEPDPDRSIPNDEVEMASKEPSFGDADGAHGEEMMTAVRAWKMEMMRRWFHFHGHHGLHRRDEEEGHEQEKEEAVEGGLKRIHHRRRHEEDEEKDVMRKRFRRDAEHDGDSEEEDDEVEEMVRRFRKAIMRRRVGHGRRFHHRHHHYGHRHGEEADGQEEGGVVSWIKGLMNRF